MRTQVQNGARVNTLWYRLKRYPKATLLSFAIVVVFTILLCYYFGKLYPEFMLYDKLTSQIGFKHNKKYSFYSGQPGGVYNTIGNWAGGIFDDGDTVINVSTPGGTENAMKITIDKNSFALVQEEIINHDDQLRSNIRVVTPLYMERMHIFYRRGLFKTDNSDLQLSANSNSSVLQYISDSVININMGVVGSTTRLMASYVMALMERQINASPKKKSPKFNQLNEAFSESFHKMLNHTGNKDSAVDILFYLTADPTDVIKQTLDSCHEYSLLSIDPSFVVLLNKEFNLNLRVADFTNKYPSAKNISTFGTLTNLIASKTIRDDDIQRLLQKINDSSKEIFCSLNPDSYRSDSSAESKSLFEFGFMNVFNDQYEISSNQKVKEIFIYFVSIITLFFPVFRSVLGIKYVWQRWCINKMIDEIDNDFTRAALAGSMATVRIKELKERVVDLYSDGLLSESQFNPLMKRIDLYCRKFSGKPQPKGKKNVARLDTFTGN